MIYTLMSYAATASVFFFFGAVYGISHASTVTKAVNVLKSAEQSAQKTLSEILDHKKS